MAVNILTMRKEQDFYFNKAKKENYPARSVYKLEEAQQKHKLLKKKQRVLDLGCGDGTLLSLLQDERAIQGMGLEIDSDQIAASISKGLNVLQQDLDKGLSNFETNSFDVVPTLARAT